MHSRVALTALMMAFGTSIVACSDDGGKDDGGTGGAGTGGTGTGATGGTGTGATGGSGTGGSGTGGAGGGMTAACDLSPEGKPEQVIPNPTGTMTLTSDKVWQIEGITEVADGQVLTIEPCTYIEGLPEDVTLGASVLVVLRGGKIMAMGEPDAPILFTSWERDPTLRAPGDWGGVIVLGKAPNNLGDAIQIEGLPNGPEYEHGGTDAADNSGTIQYTRIEYPGIVIGEANEVNGLTMGSVGSGTTIHHVMVANTLDDCFEWFGGTVNAHHLIANNCGDDMFDADQGYTGEWHTLFGRMITQDTSDPSGYEIDNNKDNPALTPVTTVTSDKVTLCGPGASTGTVSYGAVFRRGMKGTFSNQIITGFDNGVALRDPFGTQEAPNAVLTDSQFFANIDNNIGVDSGNSFDPVAWFEYTGRNNTVPDPIPFTAANCVELAGPTAAVTGSGVGAFKTEADWMTGMWVDWTTYVPE